jgi:hypothetical protein
MLLSNIIVTTLFAASKQAFAAVLPEVSIV